MTLLRSASLLSALSALVLAGALGCRSEPQVAPATKPAPSPSTAAPTPPFADQPRSPAAAGIGSAEPLRRPCAHRPPFEELDEAPPLAPKLPEPFARFTPCDALAAIFADYDAATETTAAAGGVVRIDRARRWGQGTRDLLAVLYYQGADATAGFVCGQCRVRAQLALLESRGDALTLVATGTPWHPGDDITALFDGRADFDSAEYTLGGGETLLGLRARWSTGMPGTWTNLTLYRLEGQTLTSVFSYGVEWFANGMGEDHERIASALSMVPRAGGASDLVLRTTRERCHFDPAAVGPVSLVCGPRRPVGAERWRLDGKAYRRIEGRPAPLPSLLHKLWGW
ncbi:MAG: hypothetical protein MUF34_14075 [Polyangiaceae bacterium]|jgi:hypothetical protein|nr:hypothetical protein [Polyangiaceae bacterium]